MMWDTPSRPSQGDIRRKTAFAFFPCDCHDGKTRWLGPVIKVQVFIEYAFGSWMTIGYEPPLGESQCD